MTLHLVVDPQSLFPDAVRLNNFAVQPFGFPDLGIDRLAWIRTNAQDLVVIASVHNHGLASSAPASIEFRRSDTGVKIGEAGIRAIPGDGVLEVGISMPAPPLDVGIEIDAVILHPAGTTGDDPANDHGHVVIEPGLAHTVIAGIVRISGGDFLVTLTGEMNVHYVLEASQDFRAWTEVDSANGNDSTMALRDPAGRSTPSRFYRVLSSVATPLKP